MTTLKQLIEDNKITITNQVVQENPNMTTMPRGSRHWKITLEKQGKRFTTFFSQGPAITGEPKPLDVLECLLMDRKCLEYCNDIYEFAREYDYKNLADAKKAYNLIRLQNSKLEKFLETELDLFLAAEY